MAGHASLLAKTMMALIPRGLWADGQAIVVVDEPLVMNPTPTEYCDLTLYSAGRMDLFSPDQPVDKKRHVFILERRRFLPWFGLIKIIPGWYLKPIEPGLGLGEGRQVLFNRKVLHPFPLFTNNTWKD